MGTPESIRSAIENIGAIDAELKLAIAGNHDISLDRTYWREQSGTHAKHQEALHAVRGPAAKSLGITDLPEGQYNFTLESGAKFTIYASPYSPKYGENAFQYPTHEDRWNLRSVKATPEVLNTSTFTSLIRSSGLDVLMTHTPPQYILDKTPDKRSAGHPHLRRALGRVQPRLHCFGCVHAGYGAQRIEYRTPDAVNEDAIVPLEKESIDEDQVRIKGYVAFSVVSLEGLKRGKRQTLCVNAALMRGEDDLLRAPFLVEMYLEVVSEDKLGDESGLKDGKV